MTLDVCCLYLEGLLNYEPLFNSCKLNNNIYVKIPIIFCKLVESLYKLFKDFHLKSSRFLCSSFFGIKSEKKKKAQRKKEGERWCYKNTSNKLHQWKVVMEQTCKGFKDFLVLPIRFSFPLTDYPLKCLPGFSVTFLYFKICWEERRWSDSIIL